jgi:hypothetical protein
MRSKLCGSTGECDPSFVRSCLHARTHTADANSFFTPRFTGEHCDHYIHVLSQADVEAKIARLMGEDQ